VKALTAIPRKADGAALNEVGEPPASDGPVLVATIAVVQ
jgi:hypothetical protein